MRRTPTPIITHVYCVKYKLADGSKRICVYASIRRRGYDPIRIKLYARIATSAYTQGVYLPSSNSHPFPSHPGCSWYCVLSLVKVPALTSLLEIKLVNDKFHYFFEQFFVVNLLDVEYKAGSTTQSHAVHFRWH